MKIIQFERVSKIAASLDRDTIERIIQSIALLGRKGYLLDMPDSKPLGKGLFELRIVGKTHVRIFYCFHDGAAWLLHIIVKKQKALYGRDIEYARTLARSIKC